MKTRIQFLDLTPMEISGRVKLIGYSMINYTESTVVANVINVRIAARHLTI